LTAARPTAVSPFHKQIQIRQIPPDPSRSRVVQFIKFNAAITEDQEEPTIAGALAAAPRFGLTATESKKILHELFAVISAWRKTGRQLRLKASTLDTYASAFEHPLMHEAGQLARR